MNNYHHCFNKAIERTRTLLVQEGCVSDYDEIHAVKSMLYVAIERVGMSAERLLAAQKKLREVLVLVTTQGDSRLEEREQALRLLTDLRSQI